MKRMRESTADRGTAETEACRQREKRTEMPEDAQGVGENPSVRWRRGKAPRGQSENARGDAGRWRGALKHSYSANSD